MSRDRYQNWGGVEAVYADENIWLSQKIMRQVFSFGSHPLHSSCGQIEMARFVESNLERIDSFCFENEYFT
jgi:hypothetical protein